MPGQIKHKTFVWGGKAGSSGVEITPEVLAKINRFALKTLTAEDVYARKQILAHNAVDRDRERFSETLLDDFARTLPGKSTLYFHNRREFLPLGLYFDASTEEITPEKFTELTGEQAKLPEGTTTVKVLWAWFYAIKTPSIEDVIANIEGGTYRHWSIGFNATDLVAIKGAFDQTLFWYVAPGEALEGSLVWLGAQPGATSQKQFNDKPQPRGTDMKILLALLGTVLGKSFAPETTEETLAKEIETAFAAKDTQITDLQKKLDDAKGLAEIGKSYHDDLIGRYAAAKAKLGEVKEDEASQKSLKAVAAGYPLAFLKSEVEYLEKRVADKFPAEGQLSGDQRRDKTADGGDNPLIPKDK